MQVIIELKEEKLLVYSGVIDVSVEQQHVVVNCDEGYSVNDKELLRNNNVSTTPYVHCFYDAKIIRCREENV